MSKQNFKVAVRNTVANEISTLELYFLDEIYDTYDWWTGYSSNMVNEVVQKVKDYNPKLVKLYVDSQGGDASIGLAIYNFLTHYNVKVETDILGMAGSIASVMAMAASPGKLKIARNAFMVIHKAWGLAIGNSDEMRATADVVDMYTRQIVDIYSMRTGKTTQEIQSLIEKGDYWMTGTEAVEQGFADETYNDNDKFEIAARIKNLAPDYRNVPKNLVTPEQPEEQPEDEDSKTFLQSFKSEFMSFKDKFNAFIDTLKGTKIENKAPENLVLEVANCISEPMQALSAGLEEELTNQIKPIQDALEGINKEGSDLEVRITAAVTKAFEDRIKALEDSNKDLKDKNETLEQEVQDKLGKETTDPGNTDPKAKIIGSFSSAKKED
ncbi:MAG: head maturation protease, ClpP-related [Taibaiella sp.]|jgi:ATP-dependent protease ClpP protease subunit